MEKMISALGLNHALVRELQIRGFHTLADIKALSALNAIGFKWMNGREWQVICNALGRKPFPDLSDEVKRKTPPAVRRAR
ncbi:hypothetical protein KX729_32500 [Rhizobium sp. XQZ8]|uniref:hypothetical protein n=1 Tax=Rhizobium populisoli TaxID=2859785 RepID=UPI001CA50759|nr:hypothetical protein [Rhizobium populisoli]MBW6426087.1 hypothetical protein [Rhizobium populisoli]